jgi:hypothetical protein
MLDYQIDILQSSTNSTILQLFSIYSAISYWPIRVLCPNGSLGAFLWDPAPFFCAQWTSFLLILPQTVALFTAETVVLTNFHHKSLAYISKITYFCICII